MAFTVLLDSFFFFNFLQISLKEFYPAILDVVNRADHLHSFLFHFRDIQAVLNERHTAPDIQTAGFEIILLVADGQLNLVGNELDIAFRIVMNRRVHRAATGVAQHDDKRTSQMAGCIFNAAQLMVVDDISGYPNHKQVADACREDAFGNHPRIGTGDNDRVGMLAVLFGMFPELSFSLPESLSSAWGSFSSLQHRSWESLPQAPAAC